MGRARAKEQDFTGLKHDIRAATAISLKKIPGIYAK